MNPLDYLQFAELWVEIFVISVYLRVANISGWHLKGYFLNDKDHNASVLQVTHVGEDFDSYGRSSRNYFPDLFYE